MTKRRVCNVAPELRRQLAPIDSVHPHPRNARRGDVATIRESLSEHGQYKPILVRDETDEILVGNHTYQAAVEEGWTHIAVQRRAGLTDEQATKILLVDNRTSDLATYDEAELASLLQDLPDLTATGYVDKDLDRMLAELAQGLQDPEPTWGEEHEPITAPGDRIELGDHVLVCGDAQDADAWQLLMGDELADIICTDPPYGIGMIERAGTRAEGVSTNLRAHDDMAGDDLGPAELYDLLTAALTHAADRLKAGAAAYVFHADAVRQPAEQAFSAAGFRHAQTLIWRKDSLSMSRSDYQWQHEPILYGWRANGPHVWNGGRAQTTMLEGPSDREALELLDHDDLVQIALELLEAVPGTIVSAQRPRAAKDHPTSKPVDLFADLIRNSSPRNGVVLDPFAGSGTTAIACEQINRTARLIELKPRHCDLIVQRWEDLTERKAERPKRRAGARRRKKGPAA